MNRIIYSLSHERLTGTATGSVDTDFQPSWIIDERISFPAKKTGGLSLSVAGSSSVNADLFAILFHTVGAAQNVTFGAHATIVTPALRVDGLAYNAFKLLTAPVSVQNFTFAAPGSAPVVGEIWVGPSRTLQAAEPGNPAADFLNGTEEEPARAFAWESRLAPYWDHEGSPRRKRGDVLLTATGYQSLVDWHISQKKGTQPGVVIFDENVNDIWYAIMDYRLQKEEKGVRRVTLEFVEIPLTAW